MLARVEIKGDPDGAIALQKQFKLSSLGRPKVTPPPTVPPFDNEKLIGVEIFDKVEDVLGSAPDVAPVATQLQAKVSGLVHLIAGTPEYQFV